jgi:hypothetical protein
MGVEILAVPNHHRDVVPTKNESQIVKATV